MKIRKVLTILGCCMLAFSNTAEASAFHFASEIGNLTDVLPWATEEPHQENEAEEVTTPGTEDPEKQEEDQGNGNSNETEDVPDLIPEEQEKEEVSGNEPGTSDPLPEKETEEVPDPGNQTEHETKPESQPEEKEELESDTKPEKRPDDPSGTENPAETEPKPERPSKKEEDPEQPPEELVWVDDPETGGEDPMDDVEIKDESDSTGDAPEENSDEGSDIPEEIPGYGIQAESTYFWDESWYLPMDFRFTQVEKEYAIAKPEHKVLNVYSEMSENGTVVGTIPYFGLVYILEENPDWTYIESGSVRGFVQNKYLKKGKFAEHVVEVLGEHGVRAGTARIAAFDNEAFTYTKTTVKDVVAEKQYGITLYSCDIKEYPDGTARAIGKAVSGNLVYILEVTENGWFFVESGDVRGFVDPSLLLIGSTAEVFCDLETARATYVEELVQPQENENLYYSFKSVKIAGNTVGTEIAETAMKFVGRLPYVWGGTSLQYGADCSGFVQSIFSSYGISLPRTAEAQGICGMEIKSLEEAKAGDIVYYESGPHVGIYIGNGMVVQCAGNSDNTYLNPGKGPTISNVCYMPVTSIRRYLIEMDKLPAMNGNRLDLTPYTQEQMELIWAIVAQEDNGSYEGALAVISSAMNRIEAPEWQYAGNNVLSQLTAKGQFCYSLDEYWKARLHGNVPDFVRQAVSDCLNKGIRNHTYTCFRGYPGSETGPDAEHIGANWFFS